MRRKRRRRMSKIKLFKPQPRLIRKNKLNFLFINLPFGGSLSLYWECSPPIWYLPKLQMYGEERAFRIGWLYFAVGLGYRTLDDRLNRIGKEGN